ncbi:MAG TPA: glycoside hydrolase family 2 TIM barrel-domain containing protein [Sedimentisphaerales bacterium]|nr:glycoside hydrolase family 2 TIM barrel-domain containing protein [Sedimentisphaerales bacterium]
MVMQELYRGPRTKNYSVNRAWYYIVTTLVLVLCPALHAQWKPAEGPLMTQWAKDVSPEKAHAEYPRPQMVRKDWQNLNGLWDYAIRPKDEPKPENFDGKILVPFPVESALSGAMRRVDDPNRLWYRREFEVPANWEQGRVLLNFGAVDWETTVWVNSRQVGTHRGGYDPFTFDITDALKGTGRQEIVLSVWDPTDAGTQPRGKQVRNPHKIWYTPTTGIWQTVWLEPVGKAYIESLIVVPDVDKEQVRVSAVCSQAPAGYKIEVTARSKEAGLKGAKASGGPGQEITVPIKNPKLWSPDSPFLYNLRVVLKDNNGKRADAVRSYFGMRKVAVAKDEAGVNRLLLNNKPLFQYGPLDQGFWPDGIYTAPTDEALRYDIEALKKLGCNMMRKHVKIEPLRFYYWCDKLGLLVWQDMPNGDKHVGRSDPDVARSQESAEQFEKELKALVDAHHNHPSIIMWVPFNEGWGQYDTPRIVDLIKQWDPTRLVNNASGWADRGVGDVHDDHKYPGPAAPKNEEKRAAVLGEFGGLGLPIKGHTWQDEKNWGYRKFETREALTDAYLDLLTKLRPLIEGGLSAAVYTQTTDVEVEVNGLMTYDRAMVKMDADKITAANKSLYQVTSSASVQTAANAQTATPDSAMVPLAIELPRPMFVGTPQNIRVANLEKPLGKPREPFYAPAGTKNVAFKRPVASTDKEPIIGEIAMITDGDKEATDGSYVELGPFLQSVTIDLGAPYDIYAILFWHYHKEARVYSDVVVQVADDPDFITNVRTLFNNDIDNSSGLGIGTDMHYVETSEGKLVDAKGVRARYVRLYSNGNSSNDLNHYVEVEVFGRPAR